MVNHLQLILSLFIISAVKDNFHEKKKHVQMLTERLTLKYHVKFRS